MAQSPPNVTIGEIIRYRLISPVPEGTSPNFQMVDFLPTGLTLFWMTIPPELHLSPMGDSAGIHLSCRWDAVPALPVHRSRVLRRCTVTAIPAFNALTLRVGRWKRRQ